MNRHIARKALRGRALTAAGILLTVGTMLAQGNPKAAVLHATVTITGGVAFTGSFDTRLPVATCADAAKSGTRPSGSYGGPTFLVPNPQNNGSSVGRGHNFSTDVAASRYHGPGTYTGTSLMATQMAADTKPGDQETHIFAFPTSIGTLTVNDDASGSFQFSGLQDAGSVKISGQVVWTCK